MIQLLSVIIIHSTPFDELAQGPKLQKEANESFALKEGETIQVTQIRFSGNRAVSSDQLDRLVRSYENRVLSEADLHEITRRVALLYKTRGFDKVQVTIPKVQKSGTLEIVIVEGKRAK